MAWHSASGSPLTRAGRSEAGRRAGGAALPSSQLPPGSEAVAVTGKLLLPAAHPRPVLRLAHLGQRASSARLPHRSAGRARARGSGAGILLALGRQSLWASTWVGGSGSVRPIPGEGAEGGDLCRGIGLPVSQMGGQGRVFLAYPRLTISMPSELALSPRSDASDCVRRARRAGCRHQLVDRQRLLVGIARIR
jgi:hypothetical protein